jgi:hypothetical protein
MTPKIDYYFITLYQVVGGKVYATSLNLPPAASRFLRDPVVLKNHIVSQRDILLFLDL